MIFWSEHLYGDSAPKGNQTYQGKDNESHIYMLYTKTFWLLSWNFSFNSWVIAPPCLVNKHLLAEIVHRLTSTKPVVSTGMLTLDQHGSPDFGNHQGKVTLTMGACNPFEDVYHISYYFTPWFFQKKGMLGTSGGVVFQQGPGQLSSHWGWISSHLKWRSSQMSVGLKNAAAVGWGKTRKKGGNLLWIFFLNEDVPEKMLRINKLPKFGVYLYEVCVRICLHIDFRYKSIRYLLPYM